MKMLFTTLIACILAVSAIAAPVEELTWGEWKAKYNKVYNSRAEEIKRHKIFTDTAAYVKKHNAEYAQGKHTYFVETNEFADLTSEEFVATYNREVKRMPKDRLKKALPKVTLPSSVNWVTKGYVTGVKNQGQCGSCWAFSTTGTLEGAYFKFDNQSDLKSFSEQQIVDCSTQNYGCNGGWPYKAYEYIEQAGGIETESEYPYYGYQLGYCYANPREFQAGIKTYFQLEESEQTLQENTAVVGPISVCIDASHQSFQQYAGGVYYEPDCSSTNLDHCVLVAGYGVDSQTNADYWLVKNSWGTSWGLQGYIWMSRNRNNNCGICTAASYPVATNPTQ